MAFTSPVGCAAHDLPCWLARKLEHASRTAQSQLQLAVFPNTQSAAHVSPCWLGRELARSSKSAELLRVVPLELLGGRGCCRCFGMAKLVDICDRLGLPRGSPVGPLGEMVLRLGGCSESWLLSDGVSRGTGMGRPLTQTKRGLPLQRSGMWQVSRCGTACC